VRPSRTKDFHFFRKATTGPAALARAATLRAATDLGIADAVREALARTRRAYLVLLNNDTLVTPGWLDQFIALANLSPQVGLVKPLSIRVAPSQPVETVP
jgi:GT2 family glycosyltransferase